MANIEIRRRHGLGLDAAKKAVTSVAEELRHDLKASHHWQGDDLSFECPGANGRINVTESEVCVEVGLSWLLTPAKGKIERAIAEYLDRYLA